MGLSNVMMASLMGVMSLSGAMAKRDLTQSGHGSSSCEKFPHLPHCQEEAPPPAPGPNVSEAECSAVSWGYSEATNQNQMAKAVADAHAFICGDGHAEAHAIASATAKAFAEAIADASVNGEVSGHAGCWANAGSSAKAKANVWLTSYASSFATTADCEHCDAWASSWTYISEDVFLKAVASASATLDLYTTGPTLVDHVNSYANDIEVAIVTAYADALAGAASYYDTNACWAWTGAGGCIVSTNNPEGTCAHCQADAVGDTFIQKIDAISTAVADASAFACGSKVVSFASASSWAKAIAEALAIATAETYASCKADAGTYACAASSAYATDTAEAVAKAFAYAWADAIACGPDCYVSKADAHKSIGHVLVTASESAYSAVCSDGGSGIWTAHDFQQHIEHEHLAAIAEACALALALDVGSGGFCLAAASADTYLH